ncbi:unnamed protein product [Malus baccata var. baccata]
MCTCLNLAIWPSLIGQRYQHLGVRVSCKSLSSRVTSFQVGRRGRADQEGDKCGVFFKMPLHYPTYSKSDYETMPEGKLDRLLSEYGLPVVGSVEQKRKFAMGAFLWPPLNRRSSNMAAMNSLSFGVVAIIAILYAVVLPMAHATRLAPAPAPAPALTSDGTTIDQGIAYGLMLLALVLTYLIH